MADSWEILSDASSRSFISSRSEMARLADTLRDEAAFVIQCAIRDLQACRKRNPKSVSVTLSACVPEHVTDAPAGHEADAPGEDTMCASPSKTVLSSHLYNTGTMICTWMLFVLAILCVPSTPSSVLSDPRLLTAPPPPPLLLAAPPPPPLLLSALPSPQQPALPQISHSLIHTTFEQAVLSVLLFFVCFVRRITPPDARCQSAAAESTEETMATPASSRAKINAKTSSLSAANLTSPPTPKSPWNAFQRSVSHCHLTTKMKVRLYSKMGKSDAQLLDAARRSAWNEFEALTGGCGLSEYMVSALYSKYCDAFPTV